MKIGVSTYFYKYYNYGSYLQAYALQKTIHDMGYESEVIRVNKKRTSLFQRLTTIVDEERLSLGKIKTFMVSNFSKIMSCFYAQYNISFIRSFERFQNDYVKVSDVFEFENIEQIGHSYDCLIVGSDNVWDPCVISNKIFNFNFTECHAIKNSYAASGSVDKISDKYMYELEHLKSFNRITVRQPSLAHAIKRIINRDVDVVLDPVFLLSIEKWNEIAVNSEYKLPKKYVFVYALNSDKLKILKFSKQIVKKINGEIILFHRGEGLDWILYGHKQCNVTPADLIKIFMKADYIVTDSFHGTALSINLRKQFFVLPNQAVDRIYNILDIFNLRNRADFNIELPDINFDTVNIKLKSERARCIEIIRDILEESDNARPV
jgi:hypothetical protein